MLVHAGLWAPVDGDALFAAMAAFVSAVPCDVAVSVAVRAGDVARSMGAPCARRPQVVVQLDAASDAPEASYRVAFDRLVWVAAAAGGAAVLQEGGPLGLRVLVFLPRITGLQPVRAAS